MLFAQATTEIPFKFLPPWLYGFLAFLSCVLLVLMVLHYGKKVFGRNPPLDDDLKKLRREIYHATGTVKKELKELIATQAKEITELRDMYFEMQKDRERKWKELDDKFSGLASSLAFIRGKFERKNRRHES